MDAACGDGARWRSTGSASIHGRALVTLWRRIQQFGLRRLGATEHERLEKLVADRTQALERSREMFRLIAESTKAIPFTLDASSGAFDYIGSQGVIDFGLAEGEWGKPGALEQVFPRAHCAELRRQLDDCLPGQFEFLVAIARSTGLREMRWTGTCEVTGAARYLRGLMLDITEVRRLARELTAAQKLESVGRLAAGVAHEINTPVQFVSDNVGFVRTALAEVPAVIAAYRALRRAVEAQPTAASRAAPDSQTLCELAAGTVAAEKRADLDYLLEQLPKALTDALGGLERIATIVRSMKEFAHPDQTEKSLADLNHAIESTLVIARNEYKYVADLETHFAELPEVECYLDQINQVVLNLVVNAAHAIAEVVKDSGAMGKLTVRTRHVGEHVEISISDTGAGIPQHIRDRIFDPFFTTKEVGKGTGQGLALARNVVVNKHGGTLTFESECGKGTTFLVRLPIGARSATAGQAAA
jgi:signal transduction histidine kinase